MENNRALAIHLIVHNSLSQNWNRLKFGIFKSKILRIKASQVDIYLLMTQKDDAKIIDRPLNYASGENIKKINKKINKNK